MALSLNQEKHPKIVLNDSHISWHVAGSSGQGLPLAYVRGYATSGEKLLEDATLAEYLQQLAIQGEQDLHAAIPRLNGAWAMIVVCRYSFIIARMAWRLQIPLSNSPGGLLRM